MATGSGRFSKPRKILRTYFKNAWNGIKATTQKASGHLRDVFSTAVRGSPAETEKTVVYTSLKQALAHLIVHILPVLAIITLSCFNWAGFFIGSDLQGEYDDTSQSISRLCLQVTAKLIELLVIASMSVVLMDAVRRKLLYEKEGIPLGLLAAKFRFGDIRYIYSDEFRAGCRGFRRLRTRWAFGLLVTACALVALLVGPSTALLLIPAWHESWPAGAVTFWVNGDLHPAKLEPLSSWQPWCLMSPKNAEDMGLSGSGLNSCIWGGYSHLANAFKQRGASNSHMVSYNDGTIKQSITLYWGVPKGESIYRWPDSARVAAFAGNLALGSYSNYIGQRPWCDALTISQRTSPGGPFSNLRYRLGNATRGSVRGKLPVVRTQCFQSENYTLGADGIKLPPPFDNLSLPFPIISHKGRRDLRYFIPVPDIGDQTAATKWIPVPEGPSNTSYGTTTDQYPSAFLLIRTGDIDRDGSLGLRPNTTITCSVQANWAPGTNVASEMCWEERTSIEQQGALDDMNSPLDPWAIISQDKPDVPVFSKGKGWEQVDLSMGWLNALTPPLSENITGWTTLASAIRDTLSSSNHTTVRNYGTTAKNRDVFMTMSLIVASFVVDGMSRLGYDENYSPIHADNVCQKDAPGDLLSFYYSDIVSAGVQSSCPWHFNRSSWGEVLDAIIDGKAKLHPDAAHRQTVGREYRWYATVEGYGLRASSTAHYLAFTVLYVYLALVIAHVAFTLKERRVSDSWSTITELLALSQTSPAPQDQGQLKNTSAGIESHKTLKLEMRIRQRKAGPAGTEKLQLLVGSDGTGLDVKEVDSGVKYGAWP